MILEHFAAVTDRLEANPALTDRVFKTARLNEDGSLVRDNYLIVYGSTPDTLDDGRLSYPQQPDSDAEFVFPVRAIGINADMALAMMGAAFTQLVGYKATIEGRDCNPMKLGEGDKYVKEDTDSKPALYFIDNDFILSSTRA